MSELAMTNSDYSQCTYSNNNFDTFFSEIICESDLDDIPHHPLLGQIPAYSPKKKLSISRVKLISNRRNEHHNQPQTQCESSSMDDQPTPTLRSLRKQRQRLPWFILIVSVIEIFVFIIELATNWFVTGSPITSLSINPLFGPNTFVLIKMGAGFVPCMHTIEGITDNTSFGVLCLNSLTLNYYNCTLQDLCGFHYVSRLSNQWYRFLTPIFLHAGVIHIGVNICTQLLVGINIERQIGPIRLAFIYFASGIFGLVLGSNFAPEGLARIGCSGSVFALIAVSHLDLLYNWTETKYPIIRLFIILITTTIDLSLGLLPIIDNFSHVGGFFMGLLLTLALLGAPTNLRRSKQIEENILNNNNSYDPRRCYRYFSNRPNNWWIWWVVRFIAFTIAIIVFIGLIKNFYTGMIKCSWCKYISCLPIKTWCEFGRLTNHMKT